MSEAPTTRPIAPVYGFVVVAILMLAYALAFLDKMVLSLVVDPIRRDQGLSETQMGILSGFAFIAVYTVLGMFMGRLADQGHRRNIILACVLFWSVATALFGLVSGFAALVMARILVGAGEAGLSPAAYSLIGDYFSRCRLGLAIGIYTAGVSIGSGLALGLGGVIVEATETMTLTLPVVGVVGGWRLTFLAVATLGLPVAALLLFVREPVRKPAARPVVSATLHDAFQRIWLERRAFRAVLVACPIAGMANVAQLTWAPAYFMRVHEFTPSEFGVVFGLVFAVGGFASMLTAGMLCDLLSRRGYRDGPIRLNLAAQAIQMPLAIAAFLISDRETALALFMIASLALVFQGTLQTTMIQMMSPSAMRARAAAFYLMAFNVIANGFGPLAVALVTQYVFGDPLAIGKSLALVTAIVAFPAMAMLVRTLPAIREIVARREAEDAASLAPMSSAI